MTSPSREMAKRIVTAAQRRNTDKRRQLELWRELRGDMEQQLHNAQTPRTVTQYLPSILVFLLFLSFPLSEPTVDWLLVSLFCVLNACCAALTSDPTAYMHLLVVVACNVVLLSWSQMMYELPRRLAAVPLRVYAAYVGGNACLAVLLYVLYVDRGLHCTRQKLQRWRGTAAATGGGGGCGCSYATTSISGSNNSSSSAVGGDTAKDVAAASSSTNGSSSSKRTHAKRGNSSKDSGGSDGNGQMAMPSLEVLERFVAQRAYDDRLELAMCACIIANFAALVYLNVVPYAVLLAGVRSLLGLRR